jgi:Na+-transporting NADH:ubiquinone oxidoreductase subunit NqrB
MYDLSQVKVSNSPHIRSEDSTRQIMLDVIIALIPALALAVFVFGARALVVTAVSVIGSVAFEWLYNKLLKKPCTIGNCSLTNGAYFSDVSTHIFSTGQIPEKRSTVSCNNDLPQPKTSINCLGQSDVLIGQKRLPTPPAIITTWFRFAI